MSVIDLEKAKAYLGVIHNADDALLQELLDAAEDEALQYMDRDSFGEVCEDCSSEPSSGAETMPASVRRGVYVLLQAAYQASPDEQRELRAVAETILAPYRCNLGV